MLARLRKKTEDNEGGFTLIELLVVIIIIGILAAIAIPVFLNQRKKGVDASIKSDLRQAANEMESYFTDTQLYPTQGQLAGTAAVGSTPATAPAIAIKKTTGNVIEVSSSVSTAGGATALDGFCMRGSNPKASADGGSAGKFYWYDSKNGGLLGTAQATNPGGPACVGVTTFTILP